MAVTERSAVLRVVIRLFRFLLLCLIRVGADITLLREREVDYDSDRNTRKIAEVLVRKVPDDQQVSLSSRSWFSCCVCVCVCFGLAS